MSGNQHGHDFGVPARSRRKRRQSPAPEWPALFDGLEGRSRSPLLKQFYGRGVVPGDTPIAQVPFVALDLETTGLDPERHGIVSIGLVPFTLARIRCVESRYWVLRPRQPLSESSITLHRITHEDLRRAPDLDEILPELFEALAGRVAAVHFLGIERPFLRRAVRERIGEELEFPVVDTLELEARLHRRRPTGPLARLFARMSGRHRKSVRLAQSRSRYHLPLYGAHHALTDALASAELLQAQAAWHFGPDTPIRELWL